MFSYGTEHRYFQRPKCYCLYAQIRKIVYSHIRATYNIKKITIKTKKSTLHPETNSNNRGLTYPEDKLK